MKYLFKITFLIFISFNLFSQNFQLKFVASFGEFRDASAAVKDQYDNFYISDPGSNLVYKYSGNHELSSSAGGFGWNDNSFDSPSDIALSFDLFVYVCDYNNNRIQRFDRNLTFISSITTAAVTDRNEKFGYPKSIALSRDGEVFFIDSENCRIIKLDVFRNFIRDFGGINSGEGKLTDPSKVRINDKNHIFVTDREKVLQFDSFGNFIDSFITDHYVSGISFYDNFIVLLDRERLKFINSASKAESVLLLKEIIPTAGNGKELIPRDLFISENNLYLLTNYNLLVFKITN